MKRLPRQRERGSALFVAIIVFSSMAILAGLTVVSTQGGLATTRTDRFATVALYAAESGAAAAMEFLRTNVDPATGLSAYVTPNNAAPVSPAAIRGNNIQPLAVGNPFSNDMRAWYSVSILNNRNDTGFVAGTDDDYTVILHVVGYGPNGAVATVEWEVRADPSGVPKPFTLVSWHQLL